MLKLAREEVTKGMEMSVTESLQGRSLGELLKICNSHPALPWRTFFVGKDSKGENRKI